MFGISRISAHGTVMTNDFRHRYYAVLRDDDPANVKQISKVKIFFWITIECFRVKQFIYPDLAFSIPLSIRTTSPNPVMYDTCFSNCKSWKALRTTPFAEQIFNAP